MATIQQVQARMRAWGAQIALRATLAPMELAEELRALILPALVLEAPVGQDQEENPYSSAPPPPPAGYLRDTLRGTVAGGPGSAEVRFTSDAPYVHFVIDGTQPHTITPKNGEWLVFNVGGDWVFARSVEHPGTAPNPFTERALDSTLAERQALITRAGGRIVARYSV